jgi:hypothetical protein
MISRSDAYHSISTVIERLEQNPSLYFEENFIQRMEALDELELEMLDSFEAINNIPLPDAERLNFIKRVETLKQELDQANEKLFAHLLASIQANDHDVIRQYFERAEQELSTRMTDDVVGYDEMDMLANGLLEVPVVPTEPDSRDAGMMFYQPTPVRIILKLIRKLQPKADDVFYDLGSGIGHVPILFNLLTGIKAKGVELEESYIRYSEECLKKLGLNQVEFIQADARCVDYNDGTIFYLYTPFQGAILEQVLTLLEAQSKLRSIQVCAYGPCTLQVSKAQWLQPIYEAGKRESHFAIFHSL